MKKQKRENGITMIALIITIIVMLILAGVTLNMTSGNNGILTRAEKAVDAANESAIKEEIEMAIADNMLGYYTDGEGKGKTFFEYMSEKMKNYELSSGGVIECEKDGSITYTDKKGNQTIFQMDEDGNIEKTGAIKGDNIVDTVKPKVKIDATTSDSITFTATDGIGVVAYAVTESETAPTKWTTIESTKKYTTTVNATIANKTYYIWAKDASGNVSDGVKAVTLVAYKVIYDANGGNGAPTDSKEYAKGETVNVNFTTTPTKTGYNFLGWATTSTATTAEYKTDGIKTFTMEDKNVTLYAVWEKNSYTVTYNYSENGGTTATKTEASVEYESAIDLTPTATKEGWEFVGWNINASATTKLNSLPMGASNVTLYAIYSKTLIGTFYYYNNNQTGTSIPVSTTIFNQATNGEITAPEAKGGTSTYTFRHWSTSEDANASKTAGASEKIIISSNTNYYASYTYTVTGTYYYYNGATYTNTNKTATAYMNYKEAKVGGTPTAPTVTNPSGWTERGWSTDNSGVATVITPGAITENATYYYSWSKEVTATFYYNNTSKANKATAYKNYKGDETGGTPTVPAVTDPNGWTARGWTANSASVTATVVTPGAITTDYSYYYSWKKDVSISYNANGGNGAPTTPSTGTAYKNWKEETTNANITLSSTAPTKTGYTFVGWNIDSGATTGTAAGGTMSISDITTVHAIWTPSTNTVYTVIHQQQNINDNNYTTFKTESKTGTTGASVTPAVENYEGFTSPSTQTKTIAADGTTVIIYQYTRNSYNLIINKGTGIESTSGTVTGTVKYGKNVSIVATASTGYTFSQWTGDDTDYNSTSATTGFTMPAKALTMTASATANVYTITLGNNGATTVGTTAVYCKYGDGMYLEPECINKMTETSNPITIPKKEGYTFGGYISPPEVINIFGYRSSESTGIEYTTCDVRVDAIWNPIEISAHIENLSNPGGSNSGYSLDVTDNSQKLKMGVYNNSFNTVFSLAPGATDMNPKS